MRLGGPRLRQRTIGEGPRCRGISCIEAAGVERVYSWQRLSVWTAPGEEPSSDSSTHNLAPGDPMPSSGLTSSYKHVCACPHTETRLHTSLKIQNNLKTFSRGGRGGCRVQWFTPTDQQWGGHKGVTTLSRPDKWSSQRVLGQPELHGESVS